INSQFAASKLFHIVADLSATPAAGQPGAYLTILGTGYAANDTVSLFWDAGLASEALITTATASAQGTFTRTYQAPYNAAAGAHPIRAIGSATVSQGNATFTVRALNPSLLPLPSSGAPGVNVAFSGSGFAANETVNVYW